MVLYRIHLVVAADQIHLAVVVLYRIPVVEELQIVLWEPVLPIVVLAVRNRTKHQVESDQTAELLSVVVPIVAACKD